MFIRPLGYDPEKAKRLMAEKGVDGIVVTSNENVFYTTGLPVTRGQVNPILFALSNQFPPYAVIHSDGMPTMVTWAGALGGHEFWAKDIRSAWVGGGTNEELFECVKETFKGKMKVGIEGTAPYFVVEKLRSILGDPELIVVDDMFDEMRAVKSNDELEMMTRSLEITEEVVGRLQKEMTKETTGHRLIFRAESLLFEMGATGVDHTTMAIGRSNPEIPEDTKPKDGDIVVLDLGAILHGYVSDNRRLAIIGEPSARLREAYDDMVEIVVETGRSARPGISFAEACEAAEKRYEERKREPLFMSVGHTIGIQTEELWLSRDSQRKFEKGMVFNVELYTRADDDVFVGTEDTFVVEDGSSRQISKLPHDISVVR
jgi:Xaa-Pro aminopeptidase